MPSHILVVEDNEIEQEALKAAFEKEGYIVDSASDGLSAVRKLREGRYDLALVDYRIPEVDGLASAKLLHEMMEEGSVPKLVAITGASTELKEREGNAPVFNAIVSKPYDLGAVVKLVAAEIQHSPSVARSAAVDQMWRSLGLQRRPVALVRPTPTFADARVLENFFDLRPGEAPDIIVLASPSGIAEVAHLRESPDLLRCPVIDATGEFSGLADINLVQLNREGLLQVANSILTFRRRFQSLRPEYQHPGTFADGILAYMFLAGNILQAEHSANSKACVRYKGFLPPERVTETAEQLRLDGLLERTFFDRVHECGKCGSARLNAREECPSCRSPHLHRESLIHHFRCAWQAPERQFIKGHYLVCPKCRQQLRHYGSDYDKPGEVSCCEDCGTVCSHTAVGFVCFDCDEHVDGDAVAHRDIFSYKLTDEAVRRLTAPPAALATQSVDVNVGLNATGRACLGKPVDEAAVMEISYPTSPELSGKVGQSGLRTLRRIFLHNLISALPHGVETRVEADRDYLISHEHQFEQIDDALLSHCQENLAYRLQPTLKVLRTGKEDRERERHTLCH